MVKAVIFDMFETLITHYKSPLYFSEQMAADAGIPTQVFQAYWHPTGTDRTVGKLSLETALTMILQNCGCYSPALLSRIVQKRIAVKEECFRHLHPDILPMLRGLKHSGIKLGLISNCFSEEVAVIRASELFPFFDVAMFSWEQGIQKPEPEIFYRCADQLHVPVSQCLYVGDGGSCELEAARGVGMRAVQALWYLKTNDAQPCGRMQNFSGAETPLEIVRMAMEDVC